MSSTSGFAKVHPVVVFRCVCGRSSVRTDGRNFVAYKVSAAYIMNYEKL